MRRQLHVTCNLHTFQSAMKFSSEWERWWNTHNNLLFKILNASFFVVWNILWDNLNSIWFQSLRMRCSSSCFHKRFSIMISFVVIPVRLCHRFWCCYCCCHCHSSRNDRDYNNNYIFRKSKWAMSLGENNRKKTSGWHTTSIWHTRDSSLSRSYTCWNLCALSLWTNIV